MPYLRQYSAIYQQLKCLNAPRKTPFFVVLKGGLSLKIARFLPAFCPYRGVYRRLSDTRNSTHYSIHRSIQLNFYRNFVLNHECRVSAGSILDGSVQTAFKGRLTVAQTAFNRPPLSHARQDPTQCPQTARFPRV